MYRTLLYLFFLNGYNFYRAIKENFVMPFACCFIVYNYAANRGVTRYDLEII